MKYHIAICDDSAPDREYIEKFVREWGIKNKVLTQIDLFASAESFLFDYSADDRYDILLLDIEMDKMDGIELAKEVRKNNDEVQIIFISGYSEYISEGYDVSALHYLVKPVSDEKVFEILTRAMQKLRKNERSLILELSGETASVRLHEIKYLEVNGNYVTVHAKQKYTVKKTLGAFEKLLNDSFVRLGRSYIVNLSYIIKITRSEVILNDNTRIFLPRGQYEKLNRAFISYM